MSEDLLDFSKSSVKMPIYFGCDTFDAKTNMAIDEVLLGLSEKNGDSFIRFYNFLSPAVLLSYTDHPDNLDEDRKGDVTVSRRETGGLPIYVDGNILAYSITGMVKEHSFNIPARLHAFFSSIIAESIKEVISTKANIRVGKSYSIRANGMPIAAHSQVVRSSRAFLYQGVIVVDRWDVGEISSFLKLNRHDYDEIANLPCIKWLSRVRDEPIEYYKKSLVKMLVDNFTHSLGMVSIDPLDRQDVVNDAKKLADGKYSDPDWVYGKPGNLKLAPKFCMLWDD
ncbi:MAG: lipoate--protein ligase family protein [Candidatus Micrarchaeaceae archaeon]